MFCRKCGKEVPSNVQFCHHCGVELHMLAQPQTAPVQPVTSTVPSDTVHKEKTTTKKKKVSVVVWLLLGVMVVFGGYQLLSQRSIQSQAKCVVFLEMYNKRDKIIGTASGFFIENGTTLVTNYHVIEGAESIKVFTADGELWTKATVVLAYDKMADLAILRCNSDLGVKPLRLADSDSAKQGDKIYAVGYPLGVANTMSDGIISSRYYDDYNVDVIQITAAISPGSSGGALFNERGSVIGVTSAYYIDGQNLNIAISSNAVKQLYKTRPNTSTTLKILNK